MIEVTGERVEKTRSETISNITQRHTEAAKVMKSAIQEIMANSEEIDKPIDENAEIIEDNSEYIKEEIHKIGNSKTITWYAKKH